MKIQTAMMHEWHTNIGRFNMSLEEEAIKTLQSEVKSLRAKVEALEKWVNDLQSGMYINCVYCGFRYGPKESVPATKAQALKDHIEKCSEHPMSVLRAKVAELEKGLKCAEHKREHGRYQCLGPGCLFCEDDQCE